ncbi:cobalt ABC transporter ATP-binding protein [Enemella evansiae]|uniref:ABC transporter ATP-binding protein n=1 Tax=Enemella evansiae TaxID=2016499 RepID=UPI000B97B4D7|nr:ATP-binding cassette domain-containing protein [Enemella evansiae]OYO13765.1 cobalt ABC transporter ATP-binding protein [Enemella evansiae]
MIRFDRVGVRYPASSSGEYAEPTLHDVDLAVDEGELVLLIGRTGSGKSTLLRAVNGLVPHFSGGLLTGEVTVAGRSTRDWRPRDLADVVGMVAQDPLASFVTDTVEDELAYSMESLGVAPAVMRIRVEETLDLLGLADLRQRALTTLSGGQRQRVAIGAALTAHPQVLVLDEPTSALDPQAAEEVLAAIQRLVHDLGMTVLMAEHRLERVVQYADRVVELAGGTLIADGPPAEVMRTAAVAPPVVRLGRLLHWDPLPISVRDARRRAAGLRRELSDRAVPLDTAAGGLLGARGLAETKRLVVRHPGPVLALTGVDFSVRPGEVVALMGRNGAGKSTLLGALAGLVQRTSGELVVGGADPARLKPAELVRRVGLVPQDPGDLLYAGSVAEECRNADADFGVPAGTCAARLAELAPDVPGDRHPRDLSEGQRMCLALAVVLSGAPPLLLLDEPTRGLDYGAKRRLTEQLAALAANGHGVVLSTHDVELAAELAHRVVVLAEGEVVADGPSASVVTGSPMFAPQVAKVLAPVPLLTVGQVEQVLA